MITRRDIERIKIRKGDKLPLKTDKIVSFIFSSSIYFFIKSLDIVINAEKQRVRYINKIY